MSEAADYIRNKVARLEREHANALSKVTEYSIKAEEAKKKASELEVLIRYVKDWDATDFGAMTRSGSTGRVPNTTSTAVLDKSPTPIRSLVKTFLMSTPEFTSNDLVNYIQQKDPNAKIGSIQGELSKQKTAGNVDQAELRGSYYSRLYSDNSNSVRNLLSNTPHSDDDSGDPIAVEDAEDFGSPLLDDDIDPFSDEDGGKNEPGPNFGYIPK